MGKPVDFSENVSAEEKMKSLRVVIKAKRGQDEMIRFFLGSNRGIDVKWGKLFD